MFFFLLQYLLVTIPAKRFILHFLTEQYPAVVMHQTVADIGQCSAFHTDGMHLSHVVGNGAKCGNWAKRSRPAMMTRTPRLASWLHTLTKPSSKN